MITVVWPWGLALAAIAGVPLVLHLLHRTRWQPVTWPAMRLLRDVATRRGARLALQDRLLLLLRIVMLLAIALTVARLQWLDDVPPEVRRERVAGVLLVDDGLPSGALYSQDASLLDRQKELGQAYLAALAPGDEVSVIPGSQIGQPATDPHYDFNAAARVLSAIVPTAGTPDVPALITAGLQRLDRHHNTDAELVLMTTGCTAGALLDDDLRWGDLRERLSRGRWAGWRRPQVLLIVPEDTVATDWAVTGLDVDQPLLLPGVPVAVRVHLRRSGSAAAPRGLALRLNIDGRTIDEQAVGDPADGTDEVEATFKAIFPLAGSHALEARLIGARDPLAANDHRALAVEVAERVPVILLEAHPGELALVAAALDPTDGNDPGAPFAPRAVLAATCTPAMLHGARAIIVGDVGVLEPTITTTLERFVAAGGGVMLSVGPNTRPAVANRQWFRGGDGLLAGELSGELASELAVTASAIHHAVHPTQPRTHQPRPASGQPIALAGFANDTAAWQAASVRQAAALEPGAWQRLIDLDDGAPLMVLAPRGQGTVALSLMPLDDQWSDLPWRALWVPLMRGVVGSLAASVLPSHNLRPGETLVWPSPTPALADPARAVLTAPDRTLANLRAGGWAGAPALIAGPLHLPGAWWLAPAVPSEGQPVTYAVAPDAAAMDLSRVPVARLRARIAATGCVVQVARSADGVRRILAGPTATTMHELTPWCALGALTLLFAELLLTRLWRNIP